MLNPLRGGGPLSLGTALALGAALAPCARIAHAAPEVHRFNLVISATPTSITAGGFNDALDQYNQQVLEVRGLRGLERVSSGWWFDAELRYQVSSSAVVSAGVGQIRAQTKREFLPFIQQDILIRGEVLTVPVHVGADYYLQPYTQGDFQARAFLGGGFLNLVYNKALLQQVEINTDPSTTLGGNFVEAATRDAPGYYLQGGAHMFFAARYSVILGLIYRSAVIREMLDRKTRLPVALADGRPFTLDMSGLGARMSVAIGF